MRPGRLTPENLGRPPVERRNHACFNEAGAINPGKPTERNTNSDARGKLQ